MRFLGDRSVQRSLVGASALRAQGEAYGDKRSGAREEFFVVGEVMGREETQEMKDRLLRVDLRIRVVACSTARGAHRRASSSGRCRSSVLKRADANG